MLGKTGAKVMKKIAALSFSAISFSFWVSSAEWQDGLSVKKED